MVTGKLNKIVHKVVLTGGPCGGKTTIQAHLQAFFENLGWKVFCVPETANILLSGGIKFSELSEATAVKFQENLIRTMMQIEDTFFDLANTCKQNCLVICDRGIMDGSAYLSKKKWEIMKSENMWNTIDLRDNRYNQILHLVSAANGAEQYYTTENHTSRSEGVDLAKEMDFKAADAWVGHPFIDVIDNSTNFENKIHRTIQCVCQNLCIEMNDYHKLTVKKYKFLVNHLPKESEFPTFQDFDVVDHYIKSAEPSAKIRLHKRGQENNWSYLYTIRHHDNDPQSVDSKSQITHQNYNDLLVHKDETHSAIFKKRRCFLANNQYFQLDIYKATSDFTRKGLIILETYTSLPGDALKNRLPSFLEIVKDVTDDGEYSMFNLSLQNKFCKVNHIPRGC